MSQSPQRPGDTHGGRDEFVALTARLTQEYDRVLAKNVVLIQEVARLRGGSPSPSRGRSTSAEGGFHDHHRSKDPYGTRSPSGIPTIQLPEDDSTLSNFSDVSGPRVPVYPGSPKRGERNSARSSRRPSASTDAGALATVDEGNSGRGNSGRGASLEELDQAQHFRVPPRRVYSSTGLQTGVGSEVLGRASTVTKINSKDSGASMVSELSVLPVWKESLKTMSRIKTLSHRRAASGGNSSGGNSTPSGPASPSSTWVMSPYRRPKVADPTVKSGDVMQEKSCAQRFMLHPSHALCVFWDIVSCTMILYDIVVIPLQVFDPEHGLLRIMDWITAIIWTFDMGMSVVRGNDVGGVVEMRPSKILRMYLRTWFPLDVTLNSADWLVIASGGQELGFLRVVRGRNLLRFLRIVRLLRVLKLTDKEVLKEFIQSDNYLAALGMVKRLGIIWICNHYVACGWYLIADLNEGKTWLGLFECEGCDQETEAECVCDQKTFAFSYLTSFHWSITQFTPASMEVVPTNTLERGYAVIAIFLGLIMFSSFVSNMTSAMSQFQQLTAEHARQQQNLRRYVAENRVSLELLTTIQFYIRNRKRSEAKRLHEKDVVCLKNLPQDILARLHEEIFAPTITGHAMFKRLRAVEEVHFRNICHLAMREEYCSIGQDVFRFGLRATKMYFLIAGHLEYFVGYDDEFPHMVEVGMWISEGVLWTDWEHRGRLSALTQAAEIVAVQASEFTTLVSKMSRVSEVKRYARLFGSRAARACGGADYVTDLWGSTKDVQSMTDRAFSAEEPVDVVNKIFLIWGSDATVYVFRSWVALVEKSKRRVRWKRLTKCFYLIACRRRKALPNGNIPPNGSIGDTEPGLVLVQHSDRTEQSEPVEYAEQAEYAKHADQ